MKYCAIIQLESIHEIITPGLIFSLNEIGFRPTLFINKGCSQRRGNIFDFCTELKFDLIEFSLKGDVSWDNVRYNIQTKNHEFLIINTLQKNDKLGLYLEFSLPIIGFVHNVNIFLESDDGIAFLNRNDTFFFTIAAHVSFYLRQQSKFDKTNIDYFIPAYLIRNSSIDRINRFKEDGILRLAIAGGVNNLKNRGFAELLAFLKSSSNNLNVKFVICGGGNDRLELEERVTKYDLNQYFDFVPVEPHTGFVTYNNYYHALYESDFLLTLFPPSDIKYFKYKGTASIMTAISLQLPIITDIAARNIYGITCMSYESDNLSSLFSLLSGVDKEAYSQEVANIQDIQKSCRLRCTQTMKLATNYILN